MRQRKPIPSIECRRKESLNCCILRNHYLRGNVLLCNGDKYNYVAVELNSKMNCAGVLYKSEVNVPCKYNKMRNFNE